MLTRRSRAEVGDTIVEVLIALAILGSAFGISYATATKGLTEARNAEEHSQALQYIGKQTELLRLATSNPDASSATGIYGQTFGFCLAPTGAASPAVKVVQFLNNYIPAADPTLDLFNRGNYPPECIENFPNNPYYVSIIYYKNTPAPNSDDFLMQIRWYGIGTLGAQQESLSYRLHP